MKVFVTYTVTDEDLRGRNVLHYHPFKLLRDCSTSALPPFLCRSNEPLTNYGWCCPQFSAAILHQHHSHHSVLLLCFSSAGYSIFVVDGILPPCEADEALLRCPVDPKAVKKEEEGTKHQQEGSAVISGQGPPPHPPPEHVGDEDDWELAMAISASLQQQGVNALMKGLPAMQLYMFVYCTDVYDHGNWLFAQSYCSSVRLTRTCAKSVCKCVADKCMHDQVLWCDGITLVGCACSLSCSGYPMNMWTVDKVVS